MKTLYTLGTDRRTWEDFIEILKAYDIACLVDVRRFPTSKLEQFKRKNIEAELKKEGMEYIWLGEELGGFRKGGYEAYSGTEGFKEGINKLVGIAEEKPSVIVCAERFPWKCHRRWIARELQRRGRHVLHIIEKGKVWEPSGHDHIHD